MGISRYFGDVLSIPNLFRNGGLDFQDASSALPPFYSIAGAARNALVLENSWSQVFGETPSVSGGLSNYFVLHLPQPDPVTVTQDFSNANAVFDHATPVTSGTSELQPYDYCSIEPNLLYQGKFTLSFSIRVPQGEVSVGLTYQIAQTAGNMGAVYVELDPLLSGPSWRRYTGVVDAGTNKLVVIGVQVQRMGTARSVEVHLGNIMLAAGAYDDLPYTGDPAAAVFPRGAIVMSLGTSCPPGFVPLEHDGLYPRSPDVDEKPGDTGGSKKHEHDLEQTMYPENSWRRRSLLDSGDATNIPGLSVWDDSRGDRAVSHEHPIRDDSGEDNTEPNHRGYLFCKRV